MIYALAQGTSSLRPTNTDWTVAKVSAKKLIDQVLGNPILDTVVQNLIAA